MVTSVTTSIIEQQRSILEEIDRIEEAISARTAASFSSRKASMLMQNQIKSYIEKAQKSAKEFEQLSANSNGDVQREVLEIQNAGQSMEGFYNRVNIIKAFHRRYPGREIVNLEEYYKLHSPQDMNYSLVDQIFKPEEHYGKFLDMNELFEKYLNLKGMKTMTITNYLDMFGDPNQTHKRFKHATYLEYLDAVIDYLWSFYQRTRPLQPTDKIYETIRIDFEHAWTEGKFLKQDNLKENNKPFFCNVCEKVFAKATVFNAHLNSKNHLKAVKRNQNLEENKQVLDKKYKDLCKKEYQLQRFANLLSQEIKDTKENIMRKQTLTSAEWEAEMDNLDNLEPEPEYQENKENDNEEQRDTDGKIYNPLKLPLGWDGKPIPFWLWKLHGLGVEYTCEICGNFVYMGRKNFDKHFLEQRHVHGLKCLGVQPSHLFSQITSIQDAISLWNKLKKDKRVAKRQSESTVEVEDADGNVMSERVYNDLKAQGLI